MSTTTVVEGVLSKEPEIRYDRSGIAKTVLGVRVSETRVDQEAGESFETPVIFDVVCEGNLAENVALSLAKGMSVIVVGRLCRRHWETEAGEPRSKVEVLADNLGPSLSRSTAEVQRIEGHTTNV